MINIIIADDHAIVRQGLKKILLDQSDLKVIGEASNAAETLVLVASLPADILLLDITLPDRSGLDILQDLKRERSAMAIIVLSMHPEAQFAMRVLRSGGSGYLTKETAPEELIRAIRKAASGGKYVSTSLAEQLVTFPEADIKVPPHERLSDREFQVMRFIAGGSTLTEIAARLHLSVKTVSTYRSRIMDKLSMKSNADLTRYCIENKLIE